jgi:hypothetical protein
MGEEWYYSRSGVPVGPVSAPILKQLAATGQLASTDMLWKVGMQDWMPAGQLKGLFDAPTSVPPPQAGEPALELITCKNCPRCGAEHRELPIKKLSKPTYDEFTHWSVCPATGDPVLFSFKSGQKGNQ